ncbi:MAG: YraN family protein [Bacteroidia bacterium]
MAQHNKTGKKGEQLATDFLIRKGYHVIETNWAYNKLEIDIIAKIGNEIVFVEVKTRTTTSHGYPEDAVSRKKAQNLFDAAEIYLEENQIDDEIRFDIISIIIKNNNTEIRHIEDGISPYEAF